MFSNNKTITMFASLIITAASALSNPLVQKQTFVSSIPNFSSLLTFNKYNSGGVPASITITLQLQISGGTLILDNDAGSDVSGTVKFGVFANADSTEVNLPVLGKEVFHSRSFNLNSNTNDGIGDYDPSEPDGMQFTGGTNSGTVSVFAEDEFLNNYIGTGTFDIAVGITQLVDYGNISNIEYSIVTPVTASGFIEVAYNVPEPASAGIISIGAILMGLRHRRH